jgi:nucleoid DNA-binding protein
LYLFTVQHQKGVFFMSEGSKGSNGSEVVSVTGLADQLVESGCLATKKGASAIISTLFERIAQEANDGKKVRIHGFGTFQVKHKPAYTGRNPANGEAVDVPAKDVLVFKAAKRSTDNGDAE